LFGEWGVGGGGGISCLLSAIRSRFRSEMEIEGLIKGKVRVYEYCVSSCLVVISWTMLNSKRYCFRKMGEGEYDFRGKSGSLDSRETMGSFHSE